MLAILKLKSFGRFHVTKNFGFVRILMAILATLSLVKITSSFYNETSILHAFDDAVRSSGTIILFFLLGNRVRFDTHSRIFLIALLISAGLAHFETIVGHPLHAGFTTAGVTATPLEGSIRDGQYRVQGLFDGSLFFAEFIVLSFSLFLHSMPKLSFAMKIFFFVVFFFLFSENGSRSLLVTGLVILICVGFLYFWRRTKSVGRISFFLLLLVVILSASSFAVDQIMTLGGGSQIFALQELDPYDRSSTARAFQFFQVSSILAEHPVFGIGMKQSFVGEGGVLTLDNYFLRVGLESGLLGLGLIFLFFAVLIINLLRLARISQPPNAAHLAESLLILTVGFLTFRLFFQDPSGVVFYYLLLGAGLRALVSDTSSSSAPGNASQMQPYGRQV